MIEYVERILLKPVYIICDHVHSCTWGLRAMRSFGANLAHLSFWLQIAVRWPGWISDKTEFVSFLTEVLKKESFVNDQWWLSMFSWFLSYLDKHSCAWNNLALLYVDVFRICSIYVKELLIMFKFSVPPYVDSRWFHVPFGNRNCSIILSKSDVSVLRAISLPLSQLRCRHTSGRSYLTPYGNCGYCFVRTGNVLSGRVVLLCILASYRGLRWLLEQPAGSFLEDLPRYQELWGLMKAYLLKFYKCLVKRNGRWTCFWNEYIYMFVCVTCGRKTNMYIYLFIYLFLKISKILYI